ncbi:MAG: hypothetical protein ACI4S4_00120 [Candidatus Ornithospirochaeta sp.]
MKLLFGDIHDHCGISYGYGSLENALKNAASHLDFVAVTGHAFWPDIPPVTPETEFLVSFHRKGFEKLRGNYEGNKELFEKYNKEGSFTTFIGYEMHSHHYGDHHIVSGDMSIPLLTDALSPREFHEETKKYRDTVIIPHHIAYAPEYRGINWDEYDDTLFPVVEVISKHGCSMSDTHPFPYYHNMGGRDSRNTVYRGLEKGKVFGFVGSTDHHAGYPGSYGDGALAVLAEENDRKSIIDAIKKRRTYAINADKIKANFSVDGNLFGSVVPGGMKKHTVEYSVELSYFLDKIVVYRDMKPVHIINGETLDTVDDEGCYKIRLEFGWGGKKELLTWDFRAEVEDGKFRSIEKCFRGRSVLAPQEGVEVPGDCNEIDNRAEIVSSTVVEGRVQTAKNSNPTTPSTSMVVLEVEGSLDTILRVNVNGREVEMKISDTIGNSTNYPVGKTNSPSFKIHQAIGSSQYRIQGSFEDECEDNCSYRMEIFQKNGSVAFLSPVYFR